MAVKQVTDALALLNLPRLSKLLPATPGLVECQILSEGLLQDLDRTKAWGSNSNMLVMPKIPPRYQGRVLQCKEAAPLPPSTVAFKDNKAAYLLHPSTLLSRHLVVTLNMEET